MGIEEKIVNLLSPIFDNRVYPDIMPQAEIENDLSPCCVYTVISEQPYITGGCGDTINQSTVQIDIYTKTDKIQIVRERIALFENVANVLKQNGFIFKQARKGFDADTRLYRSSSDWSY